MANFVYNECKRMVLEGELDWPVDDIRVLLVMTNTTADADGATGDDANFLNEITLDEYDGANYARQAIANEAVTEDAANNRAEATGDNVTFGSLGVGTRQAQAALVFKFVSDDTDSIPLLYIDTGGFPFDGNGGNLVVAWNAQGILQAT